MNTIYYHVYVATAPLLSVLVTIFELNLILNVCVVLLLFNTISTFDPFVFLNATLGKIVEASEAILTAPGRTNFEACAIM